MRGCKYWGLLLAAFFLAGCGSSDTENSEALTAAAKEIQEANEPEGESTEQVSLVDGLREEDLAYLSEKLAEESFSVSIADALSGIGFTEPTDSDYISYDSVAGKSASVEIMVADSSDRHLLISAYYIKNPLSDGGKWSVVSITDYDSGLYYWVPEGCEDSVDLYDYISGELISSKTDYRTGAELLDDLESEYTAELDAIMDGFQGDLGELSEKCGKDK